MSNRSALRLTPEQVEAYCKRHDLPLPEGIRPRDIAAATHNFDLAAPKVRRSRQPNKTEAEFGQLLQARIDKGELLGPLLFESVKLRVSDNCFYTPDWLCFGTTVMTPLFFEVKGLFIWDDAKVKFKAAKELHPWAKFEMWRKQNGVWGQIG